MIREKLDAHLEHINIAIPVFKISLPQPLVLLSLWPIDVICKYCSYNASLVLIQSVRTSSMNDADIDIVIPKKTIAFVHLAIAVLGRLMPDKVGLQRACRPGTRPEHQ